jgi:hypothetical protein
MRILLGSDSWRLTFVSDIALPSNRKALMLLEIHDGIEEAAAEPIIAM